MTRARPAAMCFVLFGRFSQGFVSMLPNTLGSMGAAPPIEVSAVAFRPAESICQRDLLGFL